MLYFFLKCGACCMLLMGAIIFIRAAYASDRHNDDGSCDQPLGYYVVVSVVWVWVLRGVLGDRQGRGRLFCESPRLHAMFAILSNLGIIIWGNRMIFNVKTCPQTNPNLYYPVRDYIILHTFVVLLFVLMTLLLLCFSTRITELNGSLTAKPGCPNSVAQLPKVQAGAAELIDQDTNDGRTCAICFEEFKDGAVKTPCSHYFHEECLAKWCKAHTDCPLCRQSIAEEEP